MRGAIPAAIFPSGECREGPGRPNELRSSLRNGRNPEITHPFLKGQGLQVFRPACDLESIVGRFPCASGAEKLAVGRSMAVPPSGLSRRMAAAKRFIAELTAEFTSALAIFSWTS